MNKYDLVIDKLPSIYHQIIHTEFTDETIDDKGIRSLY